MAETPGQAPPVNPKPPTQDRFYDFENQRRPSNKLLASSVEQEGELLLRNFQDPHRMEGWQAVDVRSL